MQIKIIEGDISRFEADAIVNAANNHLWMGGGVAGALKREGGWEIEEEAMNKGPVGKGEAVGTAAGRLKARYVIHAAVMGEDLRTDAGTIATATLNSLLLADKLGLKSIAFPALGTGVGGFPLDKCARIMLGTTMSYSHKNTGIEEVVFVLYGQEAFKIFETELRKQVESI